MPAPLIVLGAALLLWSSGAPAGAGEVRGADGCAEVHVIATVPAPAFLENLHVEASGRVLFTSYLSREILSPGAEGATTLFAGLEAHPVSLLPWGDGWLIAAHGIPFTEGPAFVLTNRFLRLDAAGRLLETVPAPEARFLNGMVDLGDGTVLVADSILGRIWRFDPASGAMATWLEDPVLASDPTGQNPRPGANGLKRRGADVLVSNSLNGTLHAIRLNEHLQPAGQPRLIARPGRVDDFALAADGSLYLATHADDVLQVMPDGAIRTVLPGGADGSTAVALVPEEPDALYVLTTGGLLEGRAAAARLLKVSLPGGERLCQTP